MFHYGNSVISYYPLPNVMDLVARLQNKILRKEIKFQWSLKCQAAFQHLKQALYKEPILQYPSMEKPYMLFTDASHYAYPEVLTQAAEVLRIWCQ